MVETNREVTADIEKHQEIKSTSKNLKNEIKLVFLLFLSIFVLTSAGFDSSEGQYHYMVAHQILTQGSLSFVEPQIGVFTVAPNGRVYASHEIGNTLFLLPIAGFNIFLEKELAHRLDGRRLSLLTGFFEIMMAAIYCAITLALFYALLRICFQKTMKVALVCTLALAFCTFVVTYSRNLFDGVLCMALLTAAMFASMQFRRTRDMRYFYIARVLYGLGVITRLTMVLPLIAFASYVAMVFYPDWKRVLRLALTCAALLAPFAAWQLYYNHLRTGSWFTSPVQTAQYAFNNGLNGNLGVGLVGLLFSPGKSIFLYIPLALLSVIFIKSFAKKYPAEAVYVAIISCLWLILHARLNSWFGAWGWGPRHFVTIAPVLALPACVVWEQILSRLWGRYLLFFAVSWGGILSLASIIGNFQYRLYLADVQGRTTDMIWSPSGGQALGTR